MFAYDSVVFKVFDNMFSNKPFKNFDNVTSEGNRVVVFSFGLTGFLVNRGYYLLFIGKGNISAVQGVSPHKQQWTGQFMFTFLQFSSVLFSSSILSIKTLCSQ